MSVTVKPDDAKGPGHATIRVSGASSAADAGFRISRDPDWPEPNLGPSGWQGAETVLAPDAVEREGSDLVLRVGPAVCDRLEEGIYFFALPAAGVSTSVVWPEIEAVHAGAGTMFAAPPPVTAQPIVSQPMQPAPVRAADTAPSRPAPPPLPQAATVPSDAPAVVPAKRSWLPLLAAVVAILVAAGGGWWWFHRQEAVPAAPPPVAPVPPPIPAPPPAPAPPPTPPATPAAVDLDAMSVRDLIAGGNGAEMVDQARKRLAARPQDSLLLLETAGEDRHDGAALTLLAQLYDPNKPRQGGIGADARQAAKDYREAERQGDHSGAADREALHQTLIAARDRGDTQAKLIEGDFWP